MDNEINRKRVMTRIGDIFCIQLKDKKVYMQYIAIDHSQLSSSTVRVFKKEYSLDYVFDAEEVVNDEVSFYAHTCLQPGLKQGLWTKAGKSKDIGDLSKVLFRCTDDWSPQCLKSYNWWIGGINGDYTMIGELTEEIKKQTHIGWVAPPKDVVHKIECGEYPGAIPY